MRDHADTGMARPHLLHMHRKKTLMHRAVSLPQNSAAVVQNLGDVPAELFVWVPDGHFFKAQSESQYRELRNVTDKWIDKTQGARAPSPS